MSEISLPLLRNVPRLIKNKILLMVLQKKKKNQNDLIVLLHSDLIQHTQVYKFLRLVGNLMCIRRRLNTILYTKVHTTLYCKFLEKKPLINTSLHPYFLGFQFLRKVVPKDYKKNQFYTLFIIPTQRKDCLNGYSRKGHGDDEQLSYLKTNGFKVEVVFIYKTFNTLSHT